MLIYIFETYICFGVRALFAEHYLSALFIGAWRDECAMFGLREPSLVLGLVACLALFCMCACACVVSKIWLSVVGLTWV